MAKKLEKSGIPVFFLDLKHPLDLGIILRFRNIIRNFQPDLLVTYLIHSDIFGRIFGRLFGIPKIACSRRGFYLDWKILHPIDQLIARLADAYFTQTRFAKSFLEHNFNIPDEKIFVIPNAINEEYFNPPTHKEEIRSSLNIPKKHILITCVGNLRSGKGHTELLRAFEAVHQKFPETSLLLAGDGPEKSRLAKFASSLSSQEDILFLGRRDDVKNILSISDVFTLPTHSEGMSNAVMEAMASGLPIVTTDIPVNQELIKQGETGILVPVGNWDVLASSLISLLDDPGKRGVLAKNAKKTARRNFDIRSIAEKTADIYNTVLNLV